MRLVACNIIQQEISAFSPELAAMVYQLPKIQEKLAAQVFVPNQQVG